MSKESDALVRRYAKGLYDVLESMPNEISPDSAENQLAELGALGTGQAGEFFTNPVFDRDEKAEILDKILSKYSVSAPLGRFLRLLASLGHMHLLPRIAASFVEVGRDRRGEARAAVRSAFPMGAKEKDRIASALSRITGKQVDVDVTVDKSLIGGAVASVGGVIYDASIQSYLERMVKEL